MQQYNSVMKLRLFLVAVIVTFGVACSVKTVAVDHEGRPLHSFSVEGRPLQNSQFPAVASPTPSPVPSPTPTPVRIFVADQATNAIDIFNLTANGNVAPKFRIAGANTALGTPVGDGFDSSGTLYVLDQNPANIAEFSPGAHGDPSPAAVVSGGLTGLQNPQGIAVDPTGITYVTNSTGGASYISVYAAGSKGDRAPIATIFDGQDLLFIPAGIALFKSTLYVADPGDQQINEYNASAMGTVDPTAVITGLGNPNGIAVDSLGRIYVTDGDVVSVYAASARGGATPLRKISGPLTGLNSPAGLAIRKSNIFVANRGNASITVYPLTGTGNIAPVRTIIGSNSKLNAPQAIALH